MLKELDFGHGSIGKNIIASAIPMMIAQMINLLYNLIDRVFIGRIGGHGVTALGAIGFTFPVIILITAFTNLYSGGGAPLFSIARGQNNESRASGIQSLCLYLEVGTALILTVVGIVFAEPVMRLFGAGDEAIFYALPYLRIYLIGTVFVMVSIGMNPFINAQGFPALGMISVVTGALLNVILDPLFIFVLDFGVRGAAVATVISQGISAMLVFFLLRIRKMPVPLAFGRIRSGGRLTIQIVSLGLAAFIMQFTNAIVSAVCNAILSRTGGHIYVSAMTVIISLRQVFETPILAICEGSSPIISYNYGAGYYDRVRSCVKIVSIMALACTVVLWVIVMIAPAMFIMIFTNDKTILADAVPATSIYFCAFLFMTLQYIGQTTYKALNQRSRSIFFSLFRKVILVVPLTLILPLFMTPATNGVFAAEPISNVLGGSASFFTMIFYIRSLKK